jgi:DNA-binding LytR/AlgR family response regulator
VFLDLDDVWAFEAADRLTFVHTVHGRFDLDLSLNSIESSFGRCLTRTHRCWLINPAHLRELERDGAETHVFIGPQPSNGGELVPGIRAPVARERAQQLKEMLLAGATGLRKR